MCSLERVDVNVPIVDVSCDEYLCIGNKIVLGQLQVDHPLAISIYCVHMNGSR